MARQGLRSVAYQAGPWQLQVPNLKEVLLAFQCLQMGR